MAPQERDLIDRSKKGRDVLGTAVFFGSRLADPFLQYNILSNGASAGIVSRLGGTVLPKGPALLTNTPLDTIVGLSPYRSILLAMSVGSMVKQNFWLLAIAREELHAPASAVVGALNAVFNSLNSLFFICSQTSASVNGEHFPQTPLLVGAGLFTVGLFVEWFSEVQRAAFKRDEKNAGKLYAGGLFSFSRHINYFGYTLWRAGYALAAGGWVWGAVTGAFFAYDFVQRAIPTLQQYSEEKYGPQYEQFKSAVPYKFCPYVY